ncbi:MAG TPA: FGLLP motif-containing membrane protein [Actinomycetota bacterium]|nr:FGLLP motif-containing membrane protein [Actinomycetota bacterium]
MPWSPASLIRSGLLALLLLLLILFPSVLFNSTLEEHYEEVRGWFRFGRSPDAPSRFAGIRTRSWFKGAVFVGFFVAGALLYSFLSPSIGFNRRTLTLFLGLLLGLVLVTLLAELPVILMLRKVTDRGRIRLLAGSLVVGVVCVAVSRLLHFQPGYLYGVVAGAAFQRELSKDEAGRSILVASIILLGSSLLAWLLWVPVSHAANHPGASIWLLILESVLAAVFVTGIEATVIGLLPIRFLDGHKLYTWNRVLWGVVFVVGAFGMIHLLLRPGGGYFQHSGNAPMFTVIALFVAFGVVSVAFWAYFRYRKPRGEPGSAEPSDPAPAPAE